MLEPVTSLGQLTDIATKDFEITSALKLIAVSVTQQRFLVAKHLVIHPVTLTLVALGFANSVNAIYHDPCGWPYISVISTTVVLAILGIVIHLMWKYNTEAEKVGALNWLYGHDPDASAVTNQEDPAFNSDDGVTFVVMHRFGGRIVGTLVMSIVYNGIRPRPKATKERSNWRKLRCFHTCLDCPTKLPWLRGWCCAPQRSC